mmetsp:Transcript_65819/g.189771  ORF Transcript_65819/g.189771 Transcript_65819/m.189771 type:complete len:288 (-) Transcript_65819:2-865(-)
MRMGASLGEHHAHQQTDEEALCAMGLREAHRGGQYCGSGRRGGNHGHGRRGDGRHLHSVRGPAIGLHGVGDLLRQVGHRHGRHLRGDIGRIRRHSRCRCRRGYRDRVVGCDGALQAPRAAIQAPGDDRQGHGDVLRRHADGLADGLADGRLHLRVLCKGFGVGHLHRDGALDLNGRSRRGCGRRLGCRLGRRLGRVRVRGLCQLAHASRLAFRQQELRQLLHLLLRHNVAVATDPRGAEGGRQGAHRHKRRAHDRRQHGARDEMWGPATRGSSPLTSELDSNQTAET